MARSDGLPPHEEDSFLATNPEHQGSQVDPPQSYFDAFSEEHRARDSPASPEEPEIPVKAVPECSQRQDEHHRSQNGPRLSPREKRFFPISETNETPNSVVYDDPWEESAPSASSRGEALDSRSRFQPEENTFTTEAVAAYPLQQYEDGSMQNGPRLSPREKHFFPMTETNEPTYTVDNSDPLGSATDASFLQQQGGLSRLGTEHSQLSDARVSPLEHNSALNTGNTGHTHQLEYDRSSQRAQSAFPQQGGDTTETPKARNYLTSSVAAQTHQDQYYDDTPDVYPQQDKQPSKRHTPSQENFLAETGADTCDRNYRKDHNDPPQNRTNDNSELPRCRDTFRSQDSGDSVSDASEQGLLKMPLRAWPSTLVVDELPYQEINDPPRMSFDAHDRDTDVSSKLQIEHERRQRTPDHGEPKKYHDDDPVVTATYSEQTEWSSRPLPHEEDLPAATSHITQHQQNDVAPDVTPREEQALLGPLREETIPLKTAVTAESSFVQEQARSDSAFREGDVTEQGVLSALPHRSPAVKTNAAAAPTHPVHSEQHSKTEKPSNEQCASTEHIHRNCLGDRVRSDSPTNPEVSGTMRTEGDLPTTRDGFTKHHEDHNCVAFKAADVQSGAPLDVQPQVATASVPMASNYANLRSQQDGQTPNPTGKSSLAHEVYDSDQVGEVQRRQLRHTPSNPPWLSRQNDAGFPPASESRFGYRKSHPTQKRQGKALPLVFKPKSTEGILSTDAVSNSVSYNDDSVRPNLDQSPIPSSGSSSPTLASRTDFDDFLCQFDSEDVPQTKNRLTNSDFRKVEDSGRTQSMRESYNIPDMSTKIHEVVPSASAFEDTVSGTKSSDCLGSADLTTTQYPSDGVGRLLDDEEFTSTLNERHPSSGNKGERNDVAGRRTTGPHHTSSEALYDPPPLDTDALYFDERLNSFQDEISDEQDISALSSRESHGDERHTQGVGALEHILQESEASEELTAEQKSLESLLREADSGESTFDRVENLDDCVSNHLVSAEYEPSPASTTDYQHTCEGRLGSSQGGDDPGDSFLPADAALATSGSSPRELTVPSAAEDNIAESTDLKVDMCETGQQTPGRLGFSQGRDVLRDSMFPADGELATDGSSPDAALATNGSSPREVMVHSATEDAGLQMMNSTKGENGSHSMDDIVLASRHSNPEGVVQRGGSSPTVPFSNPAVTSKSLATKYNSTNGSKHNSPASTTMYSNCRAASQRHTEEMETGTTYEFPPDSPESRSVHSARNSDHDSDRKSQKHQDGRTNTRFRSEEPDSPFRVLPGTGDPPSTNVVSSRRHFDNDELFYQQAMDDADEAFNYGGHSRTEETNGGENRDMRRTEFPRDLSRNEKSHVLLEAHGKTDDRPNISLERDRVSTASTTQLNTTSHIALSNGSKEQVSARSEELLLKDNYSVPDLTTMSDVPRAPQINRVTHNSDMRRETSNIQVGQGPTTSNYSEAHATQVIAQKTGIPPPEDRSGYPATERSHASTVTKPISKLGYQLPNGQQLSSDDRPTNTSTAAALMRLRSFESETQQHRPTEVTLERNSVYDSPSRSIRSNAQYSIATEDSSALNEIDELEAAVDKVRQTNITVWQESLSSIENLRQLQASQLEELARTRADRNKANEELEQLRTELQTQARAHDTAMKQREHEKRCLEDEITEAKVVKEEVVKIAEDAIGMQAALEKKVDNLESEVQSLLDSRVPRSEYLSLEATIMGLNQQIEQLKEEVARLLLELQGRSGELDEANAQLSLQETELSDIREANRAAQVQISSLRGELEELVGIRDELKTAKDNLRLSERKSESLLLRERELQTNLQRELDDTKREASLVPQLESDMARLRSELAEYRDNLADSKETIARLGSEKAQLAQRLDNTTDELDRRVADVHELTACTKRLLEEREGDRIKVSGMETALSSFQVETRSRVEKVVQHRNEAAVLLENALKENKALEETNQKLSDSYQQLQHEHEDAIGRLRTASRKADDASINNRDQQRQRYDQDSEFLRTRREVNARTSRLREVDARTSRPQRQRERPTAATPRRTVDFDDDVDSSRGEPSLLRSHWGSEQLNRSRDTAYTASSSTRGEGGRAVATTDGLSPTEELAAKLALAARSRLETQSGYADFNEKLYKLEDEKDQDVLALKERIKALERRTTRNLNHRS